MLKVEDKKRYLSITNTVFNEVIKLGYHIYDKDIKYYIVGDDLEEFNNIGSVIDYMYKNNLVVITTDERQYFKRIGAGVTAVNTVIAFNCALNLDSEINKTVYDLLKEFGNKKTPEFKEQLNNAILNGHITFKQYNELCREVQ